MRETKAKELVDNYFKYEWDTKQDGIFKGVLSLLNKDDQYSTALNSIERYRIDYLFREEYLYFRNVKLNSNDYNFDDYNKLLSTIKTYAGLQLPGGYYIGGLTIQWAIDNRDKIYNITDNEHMMDDALYSCIQDDVMLMKTNDEWDEYGRNNIEYIPSTGNETI